MGNHPLVLAVRFGLEVALLGAYGYWGWNSAAGPLRWALAIGAPLLAALLWGAFVSPKAALAAPGAVRLLVEFGLFAGGAGALWLVGARAPALVFLGLVLLHEAARYDVIADLVQRTG
jgi:hypothetical protein